MKLEEAKALYEGEWIAFHYLDDTDNPEGEVLLHSRDRKRFDEELVRLRPNKVYVTFSGSPLPEGYAWLL